MAKANPSNVSNEPNNEIANVGLIQQLIAWLSILVTPTEAKRFVCLILIAMGVHRFSIHDATGVSDRTIRTLQKSVKDEESVDNIMRVKGNRGRKPKLAEVEAEIEKAIEEGAFQTRAEVVQMVKDEFDIDISVWTAGRFLKKKALES